MASSLTQPTPIIIPFASSGNKRTIPTTSQIGEVDGDGKASYPDGYPPLCGTPLASGGKPPSILDENGILFEITDNLRFLLGGGRPKFSSAMAAAIGGYPVGAILQDNARANSYINDVDGNITDFNTTPASIGVSWRKYNGLDLATAAEAQALVNAVKAITPATLAAAFRGGNQALTTSGFQKLPGGLIVQWGSWLAHSTASAAVAVSFYSAFPSSVLGIAMVPGSVSGQYNVANSVWIDSLGLGGFNGHATTPLSTCRFIAVGT